MRTDPSLDPRLHINADKNKWTNLISYLGHKQVAAFYELHQTSVDREGLARPPDSFGKA